MSSLVSAFGGELSLLVLVLRLLLDDLKLVDEREGLKLLLPLMLSLCAGRLKLEMTFWK